MARWGTRTTMSYKGSCKHRWDEPRSGQEEKWVADQMGYSGTQSRQVVNEQKDRHARKGGRAKPGRESRQGLLRVQSKELGLSADGGPGLRLSVRSTFQFLERIKQQKGGFRFRGSWFPMHMEKVLDKNQSVFACFFYRYDIKQEFV